MTLEELYRLLRSGHVQSQGIVDTLQEPLVVLDRNFIVLSGNPAFFNTFQAEREETLGQSLFELGNGQWDIPELRKLLSEVLPKSAAIIGYEVEHAFPSIGLRTMAVSARRLVHPDLISTQILVVFEDITEHQKASNAKDILVAETRHRMKNLMAVVRAVARQTKADGRSGPEFRDMFMARFEAVLNAQDFIFSHGSDADLQSLIDQSLLPIAGPRLVLDHGPAVRVTEFQVLPVTMILHELATNAMKYGALSNDTGVVHVGWNTERVNGKTLLKLDWREEGGPSVAIPTREGFGTKLLRQTCRAEGGEAAMTYDSSGLKARLTLPLEP